MKRAEPKPQALAQRDLLTHTEPSFRKEYSLTYRKPRKSHCGSLRVTVANNRYSCFRTNESVRKFGFAQDDTIQFVRQKAIGHNQTTTHERKLVPVAKQQVVPYKSLEDETTRQQRTMADAYVSVYHNKKQSPTSSQTNPRQQAYLQTFR